MNISLIGYFASTLIIISLLMKDMKKLRYVNLIGCSTYVIYGVLITSYPVILMNGICVFINIFRIYSYRNKNRYPNYIK